MPVPVGIIYSRGAGGSLRSLTPVDVHGIAEVKTDLKSFRARGFGAYGQLRSKQSNAFVGVAHLFRACGAAGMPGQGKGAHAHADIAQFCNRTLDGLWRQLLFCLSDVEGVSVLSLRVGMRCLNFNPANTQTPPPPHHVHHPTRSSARTAPDCLRTVQSDPITNSADSQVRPSSFTTKVLRTTRPPIDASKSSTPIHPAESPCARRVHVVQPSAPLIESMHAPSAS